MAKYLMKYKGTYRLKAAIDQSTNDYPRDDSGGIDPSFDDIYIKCYGGAQIYHYGFSTLVAYIPSIGRGHNILKAIANDIGLPEYETYEELYKALEDEGTVRSIMENDKEIEFKFHARQLANYEQSDNIKQSINLSNDITLYYVNFRWSKCHKGIERDDYSYECNHCNDYGCSSKKEYYIDTINFIYISNKKDIGNEYFFTYEEAQTKLKELQNA